MLALFAFGWQNVSAQDGIRIVTNHPDFKVKVKRCAASGKTVVIDLTLNNEGTNDVEKLQVLSSGNSEAYDDEGNIYKGEDLKVKVANSSNYYHWTDEFNIPVGVPMKLSIQLNGVPASAESIARLKLTVICRPWGLNGDKPVRISNIPISRD